jgi:hypothetical protein
MTDDDWDSVIDTHLPNVPVRARAQLTWSSRRAERWCFVIDLARGNRGQANYSTARRP